MIRKLVVAAVGLAVLVITPYFLFDIFDRNRDRGFQFGEAEMRAAVEGTWVAKLTPEQGPARSITFTIEQASAPAHSSRERGWIRSAAACGQRSFVRSAAACIDTSDMKLKLVAIDGAPSSALDGTFSVRGTRFERGKLDLTLEGNAVQATLSRTGEVLDTKVMRMFRSSGGTFTETVTEIARSVSLSRLRPRS